MSHHFDTALAREDPRLNLLDFYLFRGQPGTTVMVMTVNPNAGTKARIRSTRRVCTLSVSM
jgi:hypothetical protein